MLRINFLPLLIRSSNVSCTQAQVFLIKSYGVWNIFLTSPRTTPPTFPLHLSAAFFSFLPKMNVAPSHQANSFSKVSPTLAVKLPGSPINWLKSIPVVPLNLSERAAAASDCKSAASCLASLSAIARRLACVAANFSPRIAKLSR